MESKDLGNKEPSIKKTFEEDDNLNLEKTDPLFFQMMKHYYETTDAELPLKVKDQVFQACLSYKRKLETEEDFHKTSLQKKKHLGWAVNRFGLVMGVTILAIISFGFYSIFLVEDSPLISKNENPDPKYRNSNPINNLNKIETAMIVYIEKSDNENDNKLINNIAKKLSENSKKSITMDKDIAYEIILDVKINKNIVTVNIGDAMDNILFTKSYNISNENLEEMANIISTNLLVEFKLK